VSFGSSFNTTETFSATIDRDGTVVPRPTNKTSRMTINGAFDYEPLQIVTLNFQARSERDRLRPQEVWGINIGQENQYTQDLRMTFKVPKSALLGESALLSPARLALRGLNSLRPSLSFNGNFVDNHDPGIRQPGDPEEVRNVSNRGSWEARASLPVGDVFKRLLPERRRSAAEEQRIIEQERRRQARDRLRRPGGDAQEAAEDEDLTPEQRLERERRRLLEEAEQRAEEEELGEDDDAPAGGGGLSITGLLSPVFSTLRDITPVQLSYSTSTNTSFGRLDGRAPFWYQLGLVPDLGTVPDSLYVTNRQSDTHSLQASTTAKLARLLSIDMKYALNTGRNEVGTDFNESYTQIWPDLRFGLTGLEKWGVFGADENGRNGWFSTSTIDVAYKFSRSVDNYTPSSHNPRSNTTITPRWNVTLQSGLNVSLSTSLNSDQTLNNGTETTNDRARIGLQVRHKFRAERLLAKLGLYKPGTQPLINMDVDLSYTTSRSRRIAAGSIAPPTETGQTAWQISPRFNYQVNRNLSGTLNFLLSRTRNIETDLVRTTFGLGLEAVFVF
jgi:hypothetical protein